MTPKLIRTAGGGKHFGWAASRPAGVCHFRVDESGSGAAEGWNTGENGFEENGCVCRTDSGGEASVIFPGTAVSSVFHAGLPAVHDGSGFMSDWSLDLGQPSQKLK
jgi:hypothetical protein